MATDCITQLTFEGDRFPKPTVVAFDQECSSSDGGLILLQALDAKLRLTDALAACLRDDRQPGKVQHPLVDLLRQRVFGLRRATPTATTPPGSPPTQCTPRFVVTNLTASPAHVYHVYRQRGAVENRIKELKYGLAIDRTSCSRFSANAFRVTLTVAAYVLLQELRRRARKMWGATNNTS